MSFATLETAILYGAREVFNNRQLRKKDIQEWSSGTVKPLNDSEVTEFVKDPGVYVTILKIHDKRKARKSIAGRKLGAK